MLSCKFSFLNLPGCWSPRLPPPSRTCWQQGLREWTSSLNSCPFPQLLHSQALGQKAPGAWGSFSGLLPAPGSARRLEPLLISHHLHFLQPLSQPPPPAPSGPRPGPRVQQAPGVSSQFPGGWGQWPVKHTARAAEIQMGLHAGPTS